MRSLRCRAGFHRPVRHTSETVGVCARCPTVIDVNTLESVLHGPSSDCPYCRRPVLPEHLREVTAEGLWHRYCLAESELGAVEACAVRASDSFAAKT